MTTEHQTAVAVHQPQLPTAPAPRFSLEPRNLDEAMRLADMLAQSDLVPTQYRGKAGDVLVAVQWGLEVGLKPLQALQNIAVINGRPTLWGDALVALVRNSPLCEYVVETDTGDTAVCRVKRRGEPEQVRTFSQQDAKVAGLAEKSGPWKSYPKRMRQMRARAVALRDVFPDVLKGMQVAEEVLDIPTPELAPLPPIGNAPAAPEALVQAGAAAAEKGWADFRDWWAATVAEDRRKVEDRFEGWKARAAEVTRLAKAAADAEKTAQQPAGEQKPADQPADGADDFVADMDAADAAAQQGEQKP